MIILWPKTAILGPQFWCWGLNFGGQGGPGPRAPLDPPLLGQYNNKLRFEKAYNRSEW